MTDVRCKHGSSEVTDYNRASRRGDYYRGRSVSGFKRTQELESARSRPRRMETCPSLEHQAMQDPGERTLAPREERTAASWMIGSHIPFGLPSQDSRSRPADLPGAELDQPRDTAPGSFFTSISVHNDCGLPIWQNILKRHGLRKRLCRIIHVESRLQAIRCCSPCHPSYYYDMLQCGPTNHPEMGFPEASILPRNMMLSHPAQNDLPTRRRPTSCFSSLKDIWQAGVYWEWKFPGRRDTSWEREYSIHSSSFPGNGTAIWWK